MKGCSRFVAPDVEYTNNSYLVRKGATYIPMTCVLAFLMLLPAIGVAKPVPEASLEGDLPCFSMIVEGLYRGGQSTTAGFQFLKEKGVKTIINLRAEDDTESKSV